MTKLAMFSDAHGFLPTIPECDLVICAGDSIPCTHLYHDLYMQHIWYECNFNTWAKETKSQLIYCAGNHDRLFERYSINRGLKPNMSSIYTPDAQYLQDESIEVKGLKIWASPRSLPFGQGWAFNSTEEQLSKVYATIPDDTDIIVSHGPPFKHGDKAHREGGGFEHTGSKELLKAIDRVKPKLTIVGHIHEAWGTYFRNATKIINCALLNERYQLVREPIIVEI